MEMASLWAGQAWCWRRQTSGRGRMRLYQAAEIQGNKSKIPRNERKEAA
jgi:hypothetical protein